jgi:hypothetical protein
VINGLRAKLYAFRATTMLSAQSEMPLAERLMVFAQSEIPFAKRSTVSAQSKMTTLLE